MTDDTNRKGTTQHNGNCTRKRQLRFDRGVNDKKANTELTDTQKYRTYRTFI